MISSVAYRKHQICGKPRLFESSSSSSPRKGSKRRNSIKNEEDGISTNFLLHLVIPGSKSLLSSTSPNTITLISLLVLSTFIVTISRLDCFHVHYGMSNSLSDVKSTGRTIKHGYTNFHFTGNVKTTYDQEALDILNANPLLKIEDLDLDFVFEIEQIGSLDAWEIENHGQRRISIESIGKPTNEIKFHITGERIRNALQKREALMPRPSSARI